MFFIFIPFSNGRSALQSLETSTSISSNSSTHSSPATLDTLSRLSHLDKTLTALSQTRDVLREAESWSTLAGEVEAAIAAGEWLKASARLGEAAKSVRVFKGTGEEEGRKALLVSLQNSVEAGLVGEVVGAIGARDGEGCKR